MAAKLNPAAIAALKMLRANADAWAKDGMPGVYWHTLEPSYVSDVWQGFSPATIRALVRNGFAEFKPRYETAYWTRITEAGRHALAAVEDHA